MAEQYDVTPEQKEILLERAKRRTILRQEFQKLVSDPHRHASGEGGTVFDPAIQRFMSMKATQYDHFKPTPKTMKFGALYFLFPMLGLTYILYSTREKQEAKYRSGEVAYKDRRFKLI